MIPSINTSITSIPVLSSSSDREYCSNPEILCCLYKKHTTNKNKLSSRQVKSVESVEPVESKVLYYLDGFFNTAGRVTSAFFPSSMFELTPLERPVYYLPYCKEE